MTYKAIARFNCSPIGPVSVDGILIGGGKVEFNPPVILSPGDQIKVEHVDDPSYPNTISIYMMMVEE